MRLKVINYLKQTYNKEMLCPSAMGIFINPFYFIKRALLKSITSHKNYIKGVVLDFGCGSKPYRELFNCEEYIGLDVIASGHPHQNEDIDVYYDGKTLPFEDEHFDSVFSSEVLEHVFNIDQILDEIHRVLKIQGTCLFTVPFIWDEHEQPYDFARYTSFGMNHLLEKHGFKILKLEKTSNYIETIWQMWNTYLFHILYTRNAYLNVLINIIVISPFTILGIILSRILPRNFNFYHNNIIVVRKK